MTLDNKNQTPPAGKSGVILRGTQGKSVKTVVRECLEFCNWEHAIPPNARVVVKPNLCTAVADKADMSNTAPEITAAICEILATRTNRITLVEADNLRQSAWDAFRISGCSEVAQRLGVELVNLTEAPWTKVSCQPVDLELPRVLVEADVFITLPVLKTHALTYFTGTLKNQWGCVPQRDRILLHRYLDELLPALHRILRPAFAVMDGIVGMEGRGPVNGKPRRLDLILASTDGVALDATAMRLVGLEPMLSKHVVVAAEQGLGRIQAKDITVDGDWARHSTQFEPAVFDKALRAMNYMSRYKWFVQYALEKDLIFYPVRSLVQVLRQIGVVEGGH